MRVARMIGIAAVAGAVLVAGASAAIRLAPSDVAGWHVDMADPGFRPGARWAQFCPAPGSRFAPTPVDAGLLSRLDAIALATPRTVRLAGSADEGRITWVTRSALMGFPDYATAQVLDTPEGPRFCLVSRQRFGVEDLGVNAAKIERWVAQLLGLNELPGPVTF